MQMQNRENFSINNKLYWKKTECAFTFSYGLKCSISHATILLAIAVENDSIRQQSALSGEHGW